MFKKILSSFKILIILSIMLQNFSNPIISAQTLTKQSTDEFRGIWISYLDIKPIIYQKTEEYFSNKIETMFENIKKLHLTDVIVQVRPFSDALYKSSIFPQSHILTGIQGQNCGYDPLQIMINKAHDKDLKIHAWINPYRIKNPYSEFTLSNNHPALKWIKQKNTDEIMILDNGSIHYNPASKNVINLTVNGIKEIINNYDIDGIHFDDYFYPSTDETLDQNIYQKYKSNGGSLSLNQWRIENVNTLIKTVYNEIHNLNPDISFGISPSGNINSNYSNNYSDVKKWLSEPGYIDYLCPQIYWGFQHQQQPYQNVLDNWSNLKKLPDVHLYAGLAVYKISSVDRLALSGSNEWLTNSNIISRQILSCRNNKNYNGFALFRYDHLFNPEPTKKDAVKKELSNIMSILQ